MHVHSLFSFYFKSFNLGSEEHSGKYAYKPNRCVFMRYNTQHFIVVVNTASGLSSSIISLLCRKLSTTSRHRQKKMTNINFPRSVIKTG